MAKRCSDIFEVYCPSCDWKIDGSTWAKKGGDDGEAEMICPKCLSRLDYRDIRTGKTFGADDKTAICEYDTLKLLEVRSFKIKDGKICEVLESE